MEVIHSVKRSPINVNWSHSHHKTTDSAQFEAIHIVSSAKIHDWHGVCVLYGLLQSVG